jgi:hypothetical protein
VRLLIRSDEPADLQEAWRQLRDDWATTAERIRSMPAGSEQHGVDGEWSEDRFVDDGDVIHRRRSVRRRRHGLHLVARLADVERARQVRRGIKYDPRPPV